MNGQCILLLPPLVTSANSREVSVFSIFLLMEYLYSPVAIGQCILAMVASMCILAMVVSMESP
ncbi:MAG TPA: hypothetical protein VIK32_12645 [Candidatus Limnocylindrales bacterium]